MMRAREDAIKAYGLDTMYAYQVAGRFYCWTYSDGENVLLPTFHTLQGLQNYAKRHRFGIVFTETAHALAGKDGAR